MEGFLTEYLPLRLPLLVKSRSESFKLEIKADSNKSDRILDKIY